MSEVAAPGIELIYARGQEVFQWRGAWAPGLTVAAVLAASGVLERHPEIDFARFGIGVWGVLAQPARAVQAGDRVEIYPPLLVDPKAARRQRAQDARRRS